MIVLGTGVIIITPTCELALQIYEIVEDLMKYHTHTHDLIMGGVNQSAEVIKLQNGVNLLVSTPSTLLDHLQYVKIIL